MSAFIDDVKIALRITTNAFDSEILDLIEAGKADLRLPGITKVDESLPLIKRALITYCRINFGQPDDYDRLKASYDEQKKQLIMCSDYTDYGDVNG